SQMLPRLIAKRPLWWKVESDKIVDSIHSSRKGRRYNLFREKSFDSAAPILVKPGYGRIHRTMSKLKMILTAFVVPAVLLFALPHPGSANSAIEKNQNEQTGTLQKMIVENGSVTIQLDLNGLNGSGSLVARPVALHFVAAANSFFPILVFNNLLRGLEPGSIALDLQDSPSGGENAPGYNLPVPLRASLKRLTVEKLPSGHGFELAVRDSNTGFTFFNVKGQQYGYDAGGQALTI